MNGLDVEPSACTWCGIAQRPHGRQYADAVGWHVWAQPSQEQILARMKARRLQLAVAKADALPVPVDGVRTLDVVEDELTGASLSLYEEELTSARLRLALASAKRGRRDARAEFFGEQAQHRTTLEQRNAHARELLELRPRVAALESRLHDAAMARVWKNEDGKSFVFVEDIAPALLGRESKPESCPCPPPLDPAPHQVGCPQVVLPLPGLREVLDGEHFATVHHDWLISRDLPELGGAE